MGAFTGGAFLVAFALRLGASNVIVGVLAAVGPLTQILRIPAIFVVGRTGLRKTLVVLNSFFSRLAWLVVAALPWIVPPEQRVPVLLICLLLYFGIGTISGGAFNLARIPEPKMAPHVPKGVFAALAEPFREFNFRRLLIFLGSWNFAINLAAPFFVVYMVTRLGMSLGFVLSLSVRSQAGRGIAGNAQRSTAGIREPPPTTPAGDVRSEGQNRSLVSLTSSPSRRGPAVLRPRARRVPAAAV